MTPSALPYSGAVSTTAPPCIGSCSRTPCSGAMASAPETSYLLVPTPMTGIFWPEEGMALVTVAPALAARTLRDMLMPAPRVRAASSASRRFIRSGVIASLRVARQGGGSGIVHRAGRATGCGADEPGFPAGNSGRLPCGSGLLRARPFGHARADDLSCAAGCGHDCPEGHDPGRSAG